jgi:hypothetical protein
MEHQIFKAKKINKKSMMILMNKINQIYQFLNIKVKVQERKIKLIFIVKLRLLVINFKVKKKVNV